jgi:hypothetical protein
VVLYLGRNGGDFVTRDTSREEVVAAITGLNKKSQTQAAS